MTKVVRAALDQIEEILLKKGPDAANLWAILTALRGPDESDHKIRAELKSQKTIPIRRRAFPRIAAQVDHASKEGAMFIDDVQVCLNASFRSGLPGATDSMVGWTYPTYFSQNYHFQEHAYNARLALERAKDLDGEEGS